MMKTGIIVSILLLLIGSVYAEENVSDTTRGDFVYTTSNSTGGANQSQDEYLNYTDDDMMNAINYTGKDGEEYTDNIDMMENGKYSSGPMKMKSSPGFESVATFTIVLILTIIKINKR